MGLLDDAIREHLDLKRQRGADPGEIERLEREALGPVRREPIQRGPDGVPHLEVHAEQEPREVSFQPEPPPLYLEHELEPPPLHVEPEPLGLGHEPEPIEPEPEPPQPPKRGFLRRHRPTAAEENEPALADQLEPDLDDPFAQDHIALQQDFPPHPAPQEQPPHLEFDSPPPPKRPQFSPQPPGLAEPAVEPPATEEHAVLEADAATPPPPPAAATAPPAPAAPPPAPAAPAIPADVEPSDPGETREWDVEHAFAAEDSGPRPAAEPEEEDVLEETPEFLQDTPDHDRLWFEQRPPRDFDFDG